MEAQSKSGQDNGEEATVGMKADLKTLEQLSSSAIVAQRKRNNAKDEIAMRALDDAFAKRFGEGSEQYGEKGSEPEENNIREATVGMKADVKTLQQLSSSAQAAQRNRNNAKDEMAKRAIGEIFETESAERSERDVEKDSTM